MTAEPTAPVARPPDRRPSALAGALAQLLGERAAGPRATIARAIATLGEARARALLAQTQQLEAGGGLQLPDGSRRRTPGGVFFHLVRQGATPDERTTIFPAKAHRQGKDTGTSPAGTSTPPFAWDQLAVLPIDRRTGEATSVKITVVGRPAQILERSGVTIVTLRSEKVPTLPKGLPTPAQPTNHAVLIARKQWEKVEQAAQNPQDLLIVEGYPLVDPRFNGITVLATNATTKQLQQAQRQRQQETSQPG